MRRRDCVRRAGGLLLLSLAACGSDTPEGSGGPDQAAAYGEWVRKQVPLGVAGGGGRVDARIAVLPPESKKPGHFCEVAVNGQRHKLRHDDSPWADLEVKLREGPNVLDLYDSTTERSCRRSVDTREGVDFTFQPTADGYDLLQRRTE